MKAQKIDMNELFNLQGNKRVSDEFYNLCATINRMINKEIDLSQQNNTNVQVDGMRSLRDMLEHYATKAVKGKQQNDTDIEEIEKFSKDAIKYIKSKLGKEYFNSPAFFVLVAEKHEIVKKQNESLIDDNNTSLNKVKASEDKESGKKPEPEKADNKAFESKMFDATKKIVESTDLPRPLLGAVVSGIEKSSKSGKMDAKTVTENVKKAMKPIIDNPANKQHKSKLVKALNVILTALVSIITLGVYPIVKAAKGEKIGVLSSNKNKLPNNKKGKGKEINDGMMF
ncbi:MAG: hypothetical protein BGO27_00820 [Alphaproteobacteria bacterium 33-17]|nr:MAG: hypothetical protein BGO27_00820 [Alphaproteobacteria bacterium 33-17]